MKKYLNESIKLGGKSLDVEYGKVAKQADGAVVIRSPWNTVSQPTPPDAYPATTSAAKAGRTKRKCLPAA